MNFAVSAMLCVFVFIAFNEEAYISNIPALILLLLLYGYVCFVNSCIDTVNPNIKFMLVNVDFASGTNKCRVFGFQPR